MNCLLNTSNVASGVKDMFYEPLQGFEITKPEEFGLGVAKGATSLMKKTVFGLSDTFSKFTGSIGKGLSVMTMDSKFQESRRIASRNRPKHVAQGVAKGAKGLVQGFASGVTGIITQPFQGAQESGVEGFFVGIGKGLLGAVAKPMIGVVDLATGVSEGIKNTTTVFDDDLDRQRLPRHIGKDGILKPYDLREALGQNWLREVKNAKFSSEVYLGHLEMRIDDLAAILTETRILMIHIRKLSLEYDAPFDGIL
jgi:vacuolar protein sorting-associated protein 13A/C